MLVDPNKKTEAGFNPNVDNTTFSSQASSGDVGLWWFLYILSWLTIIGGIILTVKWYQWGNSFNRQQVEVNQAASAIDVNLTKRKDMLIKLLEETKGYMKFEKETMENITKLRSMTNAGTDITKANENQKIIDTLSRDIRINFENYPNLKSSSVVAELMSSSQYVETEIASSRRLYNSKVTIYNQDLTVFPRSVKAKKMRLISLPMFIASEEQKQDVKMDSLSSL
ncbi:LemA family protein [Mycoplasma sp. E35C]|uniref:LemA family protein n=1 Tax=Mycoplasma sp. E35C TaxID=2801918 RepID=UPI001CA4019D|nr:LemA family protein [Mycoplasma sp. E35C]QZX48870.1 LemA family protein [Mycoplasma sp. E35C]